MFSFSKLFLVILLVTAAVAVAALPHDALRGAARAADLPTDVLQDPAAAGAAEVPVAGGLGKPSECPDNPQSNFVYNTSDRCRKDDGGLVLRLDQGSYGMKDYSVPREKFLKQSNKDCEFNWICGGSTERVKLVAKSCWYVGFYVYWADNGRICWYTIPRDASSPFPLPDSRS